MSSVRRSSRCSRETSRRTSRHGRRGFTRRHPGRYAASNAPGYGRNRSDGKNQSGPQHIPAVCIGTRRRWRIRILLKRHRFADARRDHRRRSCHQQFVAPDGRRYGRGIAHAERKRRRTMRGKGQRRGAPACCDGQRSISARRCAYRRPRASDGPCRASVAAKDCSVRHRRYANGRASHSTPRAMLRRVRRVNRRRQAPPYSAAANGGANGRPDTVRQSRKNIRRPSVRLRHDVFAPFHAACPRLARHPSRSPRTSTFIDSRYGAPSSNASADNERAHRSALRGPGSACCRCS